MASAAETNTEMDAGASGRTAKIVREVNTSATTKGYYVLGGQDRRRARWVDITTADSAATQRTAILAALA